MLARDRGILFLATGCGTGKMPRAPGTFGSLLGLALAWGISEWPSTLNYAFIAIFSVLAIWVSHRAAEILNAKDPGSIVIDEIVGILFACAGVGLTAGTAVTAFLLFRLFDILKPFPVGWLDRQIRGGLGIVADDVAAGILANLTIRCGKWLLAAMT
jgi:phosphatidylglycerophosphatase A